MTMWKKGMLAVALKNKNRYIPEGAVDRVVLVISDVNFVGNNIGTGLVLSRYKHGTNSYGLFSSRYFRPAVQDNKKADEGFIAKIKGRADA